MDFPSLHCIPNNLQTEIAHISPSHSSFTLFTSQKTSPPLPALSLHTSASVHGQAQVEGTAKVGARCSLSPEQSKLSERSRGKGWGCGLVVQCLPSMHGTQDSVDSSVKAYKNEIKR